MQLLSLIFLLTLSLAVGCKERTPDQAAPAPATASAPAAETPPAEVPTSRLLTVSLEPTAFESPNEALPLWRSSRAARPALVLLSNDPFLLPVPAPLRDEVQTLLRDGDDTALVARSSSSSSDPLLYPGMSVRAALEAGFFRELLWVLPRRDSDTPLELATFTRQLQESGLASEAESAGFALRDDIFEGVLAGRPLRATSLDRLPAIAGPVLLHIDVSYFRPLYQGEIKTPLYPLLGTTLTGLRETGWEIAAVSLTRSNLDGGLPLTTRFLADDLATVFRNPALLDGEMPTLWDLRTRALYLENFFKKEEVRALYEQMAQLAPKDPSVHYGLYQVIRQFRQGDEALEQLHRAVALDRVYALEYLDLAEVALEKQRPDKALEMTRLARRHLPESPFITLREIELLISLEHRDQALPLARELRALPWSTTYYPQIPAALDNLLTAE